MMIDGNPYEAPTTSLEVEDASHIDAPRVASGQKLVVYSCLVHLAAGALPVDLSARLMVDLAAVAMALFGVVKVMGGLGWSSALKVVTIVLMFVPLVNLITLLVVNSRATKALRGAGYHVGFFGASR